ncbi:hypothetical protein SELMODRAFT_419050 [Selaginella moellendorffii]|uniref:RRM domain-containing protein n=1 Tax=Selaginella moellendorffii TaxID=88036 RepID=D8S7N7_SELML|nr:hypothetical protein SELMODRAFT_419050 [Selaginella moellendorffii]
MNIVTEYSLALPFCQAEKPKQGTAKSHVKAKKERISQVKETAESSQNAASEKQRPARTVVIGNSETAEARSSELSKVSRKISRKHISTRLSRDGCKLPAAAIVFTSVTATRQAVATYHLQKLGNEVFWARQLGGEIDNCLKQLFGSKLKKWRLIIRNLPFKVTDAMLKEKFSAAGFVWETTPRNPDGRKKSSLLQATQVNRMELVLAMEESFFSQIRQEEEWQACRVLAIHGSNKKDESSPHTPERIRSVPSTSEGKEKERDRVPNALQTRS